MNQYPWLDEVLQSKKGCAKDYKAEWGWWRYQVGGRCSPPPASPARHKGYDQRELLTLKCEPALAEAPEGGISDIVQSIRTSATGSPCFWTGRARRRAAGSV